MWTCSRIRCLSHTDISVQRCRLRDFVGSVLVVEPKLYTVVIVVVHLWSHACHVTSIACSKLALTAFGLLALRLGYDLYTFYLALEIFSEESCTNLSVLNCSQARGCLSRHIRSCTSPTHQDDR
jgi:hypothetical protein